MAVISENRFLSLSEMEGNARYIHNYLKSRGWTTNAIAGMLGNMQTESTINPGIWQNLDTGNTSLGFGLVQWTPATKLFEWCDARGLSRSSMDAQLQRILYELENGIQYYSTDNYPLSFAEFSKSTKSPEYLAYAFLQNYERPAEYNQPNRKTQARYWYDLLKDDSSTEDPDTPDTPGSDYKPKRHKLSLLLMYGAIRKKV